MNKILAIAWKDINVLFRDLAAVALIIAGPLVLTLGLGLVTGSFNNDDAPSIGRIPVLLIDQDGGQMATALVELFQSEDIEALLDPHTSDDEAAARETVRLGDAAAAVVIPAGFSDSLSPDPATGQLPAPVAVRIYSDPGAPIGAGVVRGIVEEFVGSVESGITSIQLGLTQLAMSGAMPPAELPALGQAMGERLFTADGVIGDLRTSSLIRVRAQSASPTGGEKISTLAFIAPAMALLFLMYAVSLGARTLLSERQEGTLARMLAAPVTSSQVLSGKVAAIFLTGFIQLGVLILLSTTLFQLRWGDPLGVLVVVIAAALAATGWGLLIASIASSSGQVAMLGMALTLIFGILGGSFFDTSQSGPLVANVSRITPNRWALDAFNALALGDGLNDITRPVLVLLLMAAVLFAAAAISFRRRQGALLTP